MQEQEQCPFLYIPCFVRNLSPEWEKITHLGEREDFKKNDIFSLGVKKDHFSWISSGLTCCQVQEEAGLQDEIRFFVGEKCLIKETYMSAELPMLTVHRCLTDVTMYHFHRSLLTDSEFIGSYPDLLENYLYSISVKSVSAQMFASLLKQKTNAQKLAVFLYGFYLAAGNRVDFTPQLTQHQVAALAGLSCLTVNRIVSRWKDEGILGAWTKNRIRILEPEKLRLMRRDEQE